MVMKLLISLNLLTMIYPVVHEETPAKPRIISINTGFPKEGIWVQLPKGTEELSFNIEAENTETVLFWLIPTGTQTWKERKLIGYDIRENIDDNNFTLTWHINKPTLHDHLHIQAIGEGLVTNEIINLSMN